MNRFDTLNKATVEIQSRPSYGPAKDNFQDIADMWTVIVGRPITSVQVGMMMICLKMCREKRGHKADNFVDAAGFAAITNEIAESYYAVQGNESETGGRLEDLLSDPRVKEALSREPRGIASDVGRDTGSESGGLGVSHLAGTQSDSEGGETN